MNMQPHCEDGEELRQEILRLRSALEQKEAALVEIQEIATGLKRAYRDVSTLHHFSRVIGSTRSLEKIFELVIESVGEIIPYEACAVLLKEALGEEFVIRLGRGVNARIENFIELHQRDGYYHWVLRERRPIILPEMGESNGSESMPGLQASLLVPLEASNRPLGMLEIFVARPAEQITQRELDLLSLLANQTAIAIENSFLVQDMELKTTAMTNMKNYMTNILENMADGLIAIDPGERVTLFNRTVERLFGIPAAEAIGSSYKGLFPEDAAKVIDEAIHLAISEQQTEEMELNYTLKPAVSSSEGSAEPRMIPVGVRASLLKYEDGSKQGVILVCRDLSETKELINLRKLDRLKDEFISSVSHELRTPLTAIRSFSEILLNYDEGDPATRREFLGIIYNESERLTRLINNILDLSKIQAGMVEWDITELDIHEVLSVALDSVQSLLLQKKQTVLYDNSTPLPRVRGDRDKLVQVVINLLSNAIKFTPEGGTITITTETMAGKRRDDLGDWVRVGVKDTGVGIAPEHQSIIFDKFRQVGDYLTDKPQGTGLGLPISREIIQHLGGEIWVESEPGAGSTFYFTVPVAR